MYKSIVKLFAVIFVFIGLTRNVFAGDICGGNIVCFIVFPLILFTPYLLGIALLLFGVLTYFASSLSLLRRILYSLVLATFLSLLYINVVSAWVSKASIIRSYRQQMRDLSYTVYVPTKFPVGFYLEDVMFNSAAKHAYPSFMYRNESEYFYVAEFKVPETLSLLPPVCSVSGNSKVAFEIFYSGTTSGLHGDCAVINTTTGINIYKMQDHTLSKSLNIALIVIDETLITITGHNLNDTDLSSFVDSFVIADPTSMDIVISDVHIGH